MTSNLYAQEQASPMSEPYNPITALHYAAYRPPLHAIILGRVLSNEETFNQGLDVGCGTGYSAVALAKYCAHVYGVDPSQSMLQKTAPHEKITYQQGAADDLHLPDRSIDVVTFAGSLFYAKSNSLTKELQRVCRAQALVIPYDFEVLLAGVLQLCGLQPEKIKSVYNYAVDFSDCPDLTELMKGKEQVNLEVTAAELAHILLASAYRYGAFVKKYAVADPFPTLVKELGSINENHILKVNIYFSKYRLKTQY